MTVLDDNLQDFDPQIERTVEESLPGFNDAFAKTRALVADFQANQAHYRSPSYQEQEVRVDFINKLFVALGWDVNHEKHKNPFEQEVKVERRVNLARAKKRADYAFYAAPNFRDVLFYVEAKKPYVELATADNYFQIIRYGWNSRTPVAILTSFEEFHILDCRLKPNIDTALQRCLGRFHYTELADPEKFASIYYLFSREAVANNSIKKFVAKFHTRKQAKQETGIYQDIDESFLDELDNTRQRLARLFKNGNPKLGGETLTEVTQRVVDRLVFIRFLEDKLIEPTDVVSTFGSSSSPWEAFVKASRRLDGIYNGVVFKKHAVLDDADLHVDEDEFLAICGELSHANSPYNFDAIPIDILGNIYERFLGKVIVATPKRAIVREKPEVRKSGGVYYTPSYIVNYIVDNTVGRIISGKTPVQIAKMRFADIACGSGSFLLGIYDCLLRYHTKYYNENPTKVPGEDCERREEGLHLTLRKKRGILLNNIYGVDIDTQATEVAQLSLYLKLLEEETTASAREHQLEFQETLLPPLDRNLVCGNSLVGRDITQSYALTSSEEIKLNPMDFEDAFPEVMNSGGFDAIVGNPPYLYSAGQVYKGYFETHYELTCPQ